MLEIVPNKTTADVIRGMSDAQLAIFLSAWNGNEFGFLTAVECGIRNISPASERSWKFEKFLKMSIWEENGQVDALAIFGEGLQ